MESTPRQALCSLDHLRDPACPRPRGTAQHPLQPHQQRGVGGRVEDVQGFMPDGPLRTGNQTTVKQLAGRSNRFRNGRAGPVFYTFHTPDQTTVKQSPSRHTSHVTPPLLTFVILAHTRITEAIRLDHHSRDIGVTPYTITQSFAPGVCHEPSWPVVHKSRSSQRAVPTHCELVQVNCPGIVAKPLALLIQPPQCDTCRHDHDG